MRINLKQTRVFTSIELHRGEEGKGVVVTLFLCKAH